MDHFHLSVLNIGRAGTRDNVKNGKEQTNEGEAGKQETREDRN
jgi:hypothetical protein